MIFEYALDPKLVVDWAISQKGGYVGQFGMDSRRLISDFPKFWDEAVTSTFYERFGFDDSSVEFQNAQPELEAYIKVLSDHMVKRSFKCVDGQDWVQAALVEHAKKPFHAIMTDSRDQSDPEFLLTPDVRDNLKNRLWYLPTIKPLKKNALAISTALSPMLRMAQKVVIVDPYFKADQSRFSDTFSELINRMFENRDLQEFPLSLSIMTGIEQSHKAIDGEFTEVQKRRVANDLCVKAQKELPRFMPVGFTLEYYCLQNPMKGDPLHNRFLLTDIGGVTVPYGFDSHDEHLETKDDLQPMSKGIFTDRWSQYVEKKGIHIVCDPIKIVGTKK